MMANDKNVEYEVLYICNTKFKDIIKSIRLNNQRYLNLFFYIRTNWKEIGHILAFL